MWFRRKSKADPAETIRGLRQHALTVSAADLGLGPTADRPQVWGVVMETGYPEAVATLVVFGEGSTSLYFSNGGGVIGAGEHAAVRAAGEILLASAEQYLDGFTVTAATPLPGVGQVRFYLRTFTGTLRLRPMKRTSARVDTRCPRSFIRRIQSLRRFESRRVVEGRPHEARTRAPGTRCYR